MTETVDEDPLGASLPEASRATTSFKIERLRFSQQHVALWAQDDERHRNWPAVYTIDGSSDIYVGESRNVAARMRQHLASPAKQHLCNVRVVIDATFNKSAALDLESYLIRLLAGDGQFTVLNRNEGIIDADYYKRAEYRETFERIFEELLAEGVFTRKIPEIINGDLFKLSPFKALNGDQAIAVEDLLEGLFDDLVKRSTSTMVIQGDPGTGKTVIAIYLMKLLRDIATTGSDNDLSGDSLFSEFFAEGYRDLLRDFQVGLVVPQQSLRASIQRVFARTPGLSTTMVLTPFEVGQSDEQFDLLIVDETHRLNQRANQASGPLNVKFAEINARLFGEDDLALTQLDWIRAQSRHQLLLLDAAQSVRPADLPAPTVERLVRDARHIGRHYRLTSQMRVRAGEDYVDYVRRVLSPEPPTPQAFEDYDFRMFDDLGAMHDAIRGRDAVEGLARLVAGYAWPWKTKKDKHLFDIEIDGRQLRWNQTQRDWISSPGSLDEVGSIHTVQGYDLNFAGVIIGPDLRYDEPTGRLVVDRHNYFDAKGKENNPRLGITYSDDDLLRFITNIYGVLLTRGILGTYVYVCDPDLRRYMHRYLGLRTQDLGAA